MPPTKDERTRSTGPASSTCSSRSRRWREGGAQLEAREVRAEADVLAAAEADVVVRRAVDAEDVAVREHVLVAVRRGVEQAGSARRRGSSCHAARSRASACGTNWITGDVQRTISSTAESRSAGLALQLPPLARVLDEGEHAARHGVARGLVAGDDEQQVVGEQLEVGQRLAVHRAVRDDAHDVLGRPLPALVGEVLEVGEQLEARLLERLLGRAASGTRDPSARSPRWSSGTAAGGRRPARRACRRSRRS